MGKLGGLTVIFAAALAAAGCTAPAKETAPVGPSEIQQVAQVSAAVQDAMLVELKPLLKVLQASDAELTREAYEACANLLFRNKDSYREAVLKDYASDLTMGLDHLTVAAAAKKYICPST